jgi:hypothetical protein
MVNTPKAAETETDHEETYDEWFLRQVEKGLAEANRPDAVWVPHEEVLRDWEEQRKELLAMMANK